MITIYSTETCPRCQALKAALTKAGIAYEEKSLADMPPAEKASYICDIGGYPMSAPIVRNGDHWFTSEDSFEDILAGHKEVKEFSGMGGKGTDIDATKCSKIWGD